MSEKNIVALDTQAGTVAFQYRDSKTNRKENRTLPIADSLHKLLQHVLPKGFRRVREFGFLHGNAKTLRITVQIVLRVQLPDAAPPGVQAFACRICGGPLVFRWFVPPRPVT